VTDPNPKRKDEAWRPAIFNEPGERQEQPEVAHDERIHANLSGGSFRQLGDPPQLAVIVRRSVERQEDRQTVAVRAADELS
jgi:hypothetical protein